MFAQIPQTTFQKFAKIVVGRKMWAVVKRVYQNKTTFCVYTQASKGDRFAKKLFDVNEKEALYWKFYLPSSSELKISDDADVALELDRNDYNLPIPNSGVEGFNKLKKIINLPLAVKDLLNKSFVSEAKILKNIIQKAYPEVSEATYNNAGWFVLHHK